MNGLVTPQKIATKNRYITESVEHINTYVNYYFDTMSNIIKSYLLFSLIIPKKLFYNK